MAGINYPAEFDRFYEPSFPEETSLSKGADNVGQDTRNHYQHHHDLGQAVERLQRGAAYHDHDHSGDEGTGPDDPARIHRGHRLKQAHTHEQVDTDTAAGIHHTLAAPSIDDNAGVGAARYQAAPGDHTHDYLGPTIRNQTYLPCTSTTRPDTPFPGQMIYETDTNAMRVWSFSGTANLTGMSGLDDFNRTSVAGLNLPTPAPPLWEQTYNVAPPANENQSGHGRFATPDGMRASWIRGGTTFNRCVARRINSADAQTLSDDQVVEWSSGVAVPYFRLSETEWGKYSMLTAAQRLEFAQSQASSDVYLRMSADGQKYIRVQVAFFHLICYATVAGAGDEKMIGAVNVWTFGDSPGRTPTTRVKAQGRTITVYIDGKVTATFFDSGADSMIGPAFRGWGIGMQAGVEKNSAGTAIGQTVWGYFDWVKCQDEQMYTQGFQWTLLPISATPRVALTSASRVDVTAGRTLFYDIVWRKPDPKDDNFGSFALATPTEIRIKETGLYTLTGTVSLTCNLSRELGRWDYHDATRPDIGYSVWYNDYVTAVLAVRLYVNGQATILGTTAPGYAANYQINTRQRFNKGDVLRLSASWSGWSNVSANGLAGRSYATVNDNQPPLPTVGSSPFYTSETYYAGGVDLNNARLELNYVST